MLLKKAPDMKYSEVTPKKLYLSRRPASAESGGHEEHSVPSPRGQDNSLPGRCRLHQLL